MYLLVFAICCAFITSIGFLYRYGNIRNQHPLVSVSVVVAWSFSFLIVFTIPLDITAVSLLWDDVIIITYDSHLFDEIVDSLSAMFV